ncbi:acyl-CoA synthetase [Catellatospora sp. TT07R-123]|uniref:AMP-binding protein n=1 Tax=Catellatospora sp. TT07R-123 TaxID=2733863 RepID=UPI001B1DA461|nr:AMP-binding protein [Catellatospora sp. TT07R-123]GHJ43232.1 acyl-CoA synthetase [Catellatospora sp. TT07R-123]
MNTPNYVRHGLELFASYADREALVAGERRMSYAELRTAVLDLATNLRDHGVKPGSSVLMMFANPIEGPIAQLALHLLGCRTLWIMPGNKQREFNEYTQLLAESDAFMYDPRTHADKGAELAASAPAVPVFCLGPGGVGPDLLVPVADGAAPLDVESFDTEPESIFQTSGTVGTPKLVHHRNSFFAQAQALAVAYRDSGLPSLRQYSISPFWAVSGQMTAFLVIFGGGMLVLGATFDPEGFLKVLERERINSTFLSPAMFYEVLDHPAVETTDTSNLFMFNLGGAGANPARLRQGIERFGPVLRIIYGLSESTMVTTLPGLTYDPEHPQRIGSAGTAYGDVRIEVRGEDGRTVLPVGEIGEIWIASNLNMAGYWGDPELTAQTLVDGWVRTRDLGYADTDGYLYLVDRIQDIIISGLGARKIHSRVVEDVIAAHPSVKSVAVIGVPDEKLGQAVYAYVVPTEPGAVTDEQLRELVKVELIPQAGPHHVEFVERLPLTRSGKVDKKALRAQYAAR